MKTHLKLGTRKSLLAWAQSSWFAQELTRIHRDSGKELSVELIGIETQGDKILDKPLSQIEGKEFFTAELDRALLRGDVDLTVHSMKDLSLERPPGIILAATPPREFAHDVAIFHCSVIERLKMGLPIRVGTSSPRRLTLVPGFLKNALPRFSAQTSPQLKFLEIRGNVNTRLSRIHEPESSDKKLDGVILAFAGLERLAHDPVAKLELLRLMQNALLMVLPLRENPTAPAQGALAVECRTDQPETQLLLKALHDSKTLEGVGAERKVLEEWGGGCHQKLGASWFQDHLYVKGQKPSGESVDEVRGTTTGKLSNYYLKVDTSEIFRFNEKSLSAEEKSTFLQATAIFIAHSRAVEFLSDEAKQKLKEESPSKHIWVPGTQSWFKLAAQGIWVEGCTDALGAKALEPFLKKSFLNLRESTFKKANWVFLTHAESAEMAPKLSFQLKVLPTYEHEFVRVPSSVLNATHLYWGSGLAFRTVLKNLKTEDEKKNFLSKSHACGPGRTASVIREFGIQPAIFLADKE